jgi:hypothetical protein
VLAALGLALGAWGLAQWLFDLHYATGGDVGVRPGVDQTSGGIGQLQGGLYGYPVAVIFAFAALVSRQVRSQKARWLLGTILVLNAVSLLLTYERTLWAASLAGCMVALLKSGAPARRVVARWAPAGVVVLLACLIALGEARTAAERLVSVTRYRSDQAVEYRAVETKNVIREIKERPLTGSGLGTTITWGDDRVFATQTTPFAHNGYLWLAWKTGIPAAVLFAVAILLVAMSRGPPHDDRRLTTLRTGGQAALFALLIINVTFPAFNALGITAVIGVLAAVCLWPGATSGAYSRDR